MCPFAGFDETGTATLKSCLLAAEEMLQAIVGELKESPAGAIYPETLK